MRLLSNIGLLLFTIVLAFGQGPAEQTFDIRNGDQKGKLIVADNDLRFDSLTDAKHSRVWKYSEIRSFEKKFRAFRVRPFSGDRYDFQVDNNKTRDRIYDIISRKVVAARELRGSVKK